MAATEDNNLAIDKAANAGQTVHSIGVNRDAVEKHDLTVARR